MKLSRLLVVPILVLGLLLSIAPLVDAGQTRVRGYTRKNGTYVQPHYRTTPDSSRSNNWNSQGNINPYTGKQGTVDPYQPRRRRSTW